MPAPRRSGSGRSKEAIIHSKYKKRSSQTPALSHGQSNEAEERFWIKLITISSLILTTIVSAVVVAALYKGWSIKGNLYNAINQKRATAQIIVQLAAHLLGAIQVQAVCRVINFSSRIKMTMQPTPLDRLKLWQALSTAGLDWTISMPSWLLVLFFWLAALAPLALWAGALTPVRTSTIFSDAGSISVPQYSQNSYGYWSQNSLNNSGKSFFSPIGTFTYLPIEERLGYLVQDGSAASSVDGQPLVHLKNDMSNYTFIGRSYGVASSIGLTDGWINGEYGAIGYSYNETGYHASVECTLNSSSLYGLQVLAEGHSERLWKTPFFYLATGPGPHTTKSPSCADGNLTDCGGFIIVGIGGDQDIVAAGWWAAIESGLAFSGLPQSKNYLNKARPPLSKAIISLAAGSAYRNLNNTQCSISVIPTNFSICVDTINRTISVTPQNNDTIVDIEPSGFIADSASSVLGYMSMIDTTLYSSVIGTMLQRNINNLNQRYGLSSSTRDTIDQGVAESLEALIDDYLLAIASAQLLVAKDSIEATARIFSYGFNIGEKPYAFAVFALNNLVVLGVIFEAVQTKRWIHLPKFNYTDVTSVVVASSLGGHAVGNAVLKGSKWTGGSLDRAAGTVPVVLRQDEGIVLGLAHADNSDNENEEAGDISLEAYPNDPQRSRHQVTASDHLLQD